MTQFGVGKAQESEAAPSPPPRKRPGCRQKEDWQDQASPESPTTSSIKQTFSCLAPGLEPGTLTISFPCWERELVQKEKAAPGACVAGRS